jgi:WD40 repeat protein
MRHEGKVYSAEFSPDGQRVVTISQDYTGRVWDAASGKPIGEPMQHEGPISSARFSADGQRVVTASGDTARVWDVPAIGNQHTPEDVLLLAELAEATCGFALHVFGQAEILAALTPDQLKRHGRKSQQSLNNNIRE